MEAIVRWDGYDTQAVDAGLAGPTTALALSQSYGSPGITGTYVAYCRYVDKYGNTSDLSPVSAELAAVGASSINYASVPVPSDSKIVRRQILRNTNGQERTFYVDIDTTDIASTTLSSSRTDSDLSAQEAVPLLDSDGNLFANRHGLPPNHKPFIAFHLTRMWAAGEISYSEGSCEVTNGSATVTGRGTEWTSEMAGRQLHVAGATQAYEVDSVDEVAQTLALTAAYADTTNAFAAYAIRPYPAEQNLLYFSEANLPESWPATNALDLPEDGDQVTGLMPKDSFLYVLKTRHVYRVTAQSDPANDAYIFLACPRGCVNDRSWVIADEVAYLLDEGGVYAFDGSDSAKNVSTPIQTFFRQTGGGLRINWRAQRFFHASHSPGEETIRFFVTLTGEYLPRHALCYAYRLDRWWLEEYPLRVGCSTIGRRGRPTGGWQLGVETPFLGGPGGSIFALTGAALDGVPEGNTTSRGTVTSAGRCSLTDERAAFGSLVGTPVTIAEGRGRGQVRVIVSNTATTLTLDRPWATKPDTTSVYQVGGIPYSYKTHRLRMAPAETRDGNAVEITFPPLSGQTCRLSVSHDYGPASAKGITRQGVYTSDTRNETETEIDLGAEPGSVLQQFPRHREGATGGPRFVTVGLAGVSGEPRVSFGETVLSGVL